jgi:hypothetical protein
LPQPEPETIAVRVLAFRSQLSSFAIHSFKEQAPITQAPHNRKIARFAGNANAICTPDELMGD